MLRGEGCREKRVCLVKGIVEIWRWEHCVGGHSVCSLWPELGVAEERKER